MNSSNYLRGMRGRSRHPKPSVIFVGDKKVFSRLGHTLFFAKFEGEQIDTSFFLAESAFQSQCSERLVRFPESTLPHPRRIQFQFRQRNCFTVSMFDQQGGFRECLTSIPLFILAWLFCCGAMNPTLMPNRESSELGIETISQNRRESTLQRGSKWVDTRWAG